MSFSAVLAVPAAYLLVGFVLCLNRAFRRRRLSDLLPGLACLAGIAAEFALIAEFITKM